MKFYKLSWWEFANGSWEHKSKIVTPKPDNVEVLLPKGVWLYDVTLKELKDDKDIQV